MATASAIQETIAVPKSPQSSNRDEFIIDRKKLKLIAEVQEKLLDLFNVTISYSSAFSDDIVGDKQWVEVEGLPENRKLAKEYIQTLCNPIEVHIMKVPGELESMLRDPNTYGKIEKQSRTVIQFEKQGEVLIYGNDALSVTLASSALEDLISQHMDEASFEPFQHSGQKEASRRLNEELKRRLSTENGHTENEDDLMSLNNAIKRTILDVLQSRSNDDRRETIQDYGIKLHREESDSGYISIHSDSSKDAESRSSLGEAAKQLGQIQLDAASVQQNNSNNSCGEVSTVAVEESSSSAQDKGKYLRDWALSKGYAEDKIQMVFDKHGNELHFQTFYRALNNIACTDSEPSPSTAVSHQATDSVTGVAEDVPKTDPLQPSKQVVSYISKLSQDFVEEDDEVSREELIKRNAERQRLLMDIFERRKGNKEETSEPEVVEISDDEEEDVATKQGDKVDSHPYQQHQGYRGPYNRAQHNRHQQPQQYQHRSRSPINQNHNKTTYNTAGRNFLQGRSPSPKRYRSQNHNAGCSGAQTSDQTIDNSESLRPAIAVRTNKRYIVIDGSNVAFTHGNGHIFSCRGIELAIDYFRKKGHTEITAFVPQWRTRTLNRDYPISDQHLLTQLKGQGYLVFTPSRRVPGRNIVCYDDRYVIRLAEETEGIVVSNDNYRDLWQEKVEWRHIIENRLLMFSFVGDIFMPPDDPLGKDGPTLEQFLEKGNWVATTGDARQSQMGSVQQIVRPHFQHQQQQPSFQPRNAPLQPYRPPLLPHPPQHNAWNNRLQFGNNQPHRQPQRHSQQQRNNPSHNQMRNNPAHGQAQAYNHRFDSSRQARGRGEDTVDGSDSTWQRVGHRRQDNPKKGPSRDPKVTDQLQKQLSDVFSENKEAIETVLKDNPSETDLNTLSAYLLNYIDHN